MRHSYKGSAVTHAAQSRALKHSPSISSFTLLFLSLLLYKDSTKLIQSPVNSFFFFLWSGNIGPNPEAVQLSQSLKHQLPQ